MLKNSKAKGSRNERRSRDIYLKRGFYVIKAGGSLGMWDIVALGPDGVDLVQVKSNRNPPKDEMAILKAFVPFHYCRKLLHVWKDYQREPVETVL